MFHLNCINIEKQDSGSLRRTFFFFFFPPVSVLCLTAKLHLFIDFCNYQLLFQIVLKFLFLYQKFRRYHLLGMHMMWQHSERLWLHKVRSCWPNWDHRGWKKNFGVLSRPSFSHSCIQMQCKYKGEAGEIQEKESLMHTQFHSHAH